VSYTYPESVRELTPLFKAMTPEIIQSFIFRAEAKINRRLGGKYAIPLRKQVGYYSTGLVSITANSTTLSGVSTEFTSEIVEGQMLYLVGSREAVKVQSITDDDTIVLFHAVTRTATSSSFWVIPDEITTASEYLTASMLIEKEFSRQAYNQEGVKSFRNQYELLAKEEIDGLLLGNYYNDELVAQSSSKNEARIIKAYPSETMTLTKDFITEVNSKSFTKIDITSDNGYVEV
jgi:hypothetical protein